MKERLILMSAPMVVASIGGSKTQTRRVVKDQEAINFMAGDQDDPDNEGLGLRWGQLRDDNGHLSKPQWLAYCADYPEEGAIGLGTAYGQPGDLLVVRETVYAWGRWETRFNAKKGRDEWRFVDMTLESGRTYCYAETSANPGPKGLKRSGGVAPAWWKRPAIFMPRAASRIILEVTDVRIERLQDISAADCISEGIGFEVRYGGHCLPDGSHFHCTDPRESYWSLWEALNGPGSVEANPWVWVIGFQRTTS